VANSGAQRPPNEHSWTLTDGRREVGDHVVSRAAVLKVIE
jgi:hypothetical protein